METYINFQILWTEQALLLQIIQIIKTDEVKVVEEVHKTDEELDNNKTTLQLKVLTILLYEIIYRLTDLSLEKR
jgi:hypothetical protein